MLAELLTRPVRSQLNPCCGMAASTMLTVVTSFQHLQSQRTRRLPVHACSGFATNFSRSIEIDSAGSNHLHLGASEI